jgi:hypothetical protein
MGKDHAMAETFDQWARAEISRLRTEADALQRALNKYLESSSSKLGSAVRTNGATSPGYTPTHAPKRAPSVARKGSKRGFVLARIGESIGGATTGELWEAIHRVHPDMKRSSLRALLYLEAKSGNIERRGERYILKQDRPSAPTLGLSD